MLGAMPAPFTFANLLTRKLRRISYHRRHLPPAGKGFPNPPLRVQQASVFRQVVGVQRADHDAADARVGGYGRQVGRVSLAAVEGLRFPHPSILYWPQSSC